MQRPPCVLSPCECATDAVSPAAVHPGTLQAGWCTPAAVTLLSACWPRLYSSLQSPAQATAIPLFSPQDDANLDPLSAMEKYCRSELPQQRLAYAAVGVTVLALQQLTA